MQMRVSVALAHQGGVTILSDRTERSRVLNSDCLMCLSESTRAIDTCLRRLAVQPGPLQRRLEGLGVMAKLTLTWSIPDWIDDGLHPNTLGGLGIGRRSHSNSPTLGAAITPG
jgi:hypothetical protein